MKALLLVAHGSRRAASNQEVVELSERLAAAAGESFGVVECAFLELAKPSIPDGIQACIDQGAGEVVVLPYLLSAGRHVVEDIPAEVAVKQRECPDIEIRIAPYLGTADELVPVLLGLTRAI